MDILAFIVGFAAGGAVAYYFRGAVEKAVAIAAGLFAATFGGGK